MTDKRLIEYFPIDAQALLTVKGVDLLETLGLPAIRQVVRDVLCGINIRNATETLTRRRISLLNAALLTMYLKAQDADPQLLDSLPERARKEFLASRGIPAEKTVLRWVLGLTTKQVQNVLRSDDQAWEEYIKLYRQTLSETSVTASELYGPLAGSIKTGDKAVEVGWVWFNYFMSALGSQTLAIRGSEKSIYGKLFEKLVLGGVLHVLGFDLVRENDVSPGGFWLSSRGRKRESDATAIFDVGEGVRFDIGFIGSGNSEISLDKVSRFERQIDIDGATVFMHTFIIVDRIGKGSRVVEMAEEIGGTIVQMSASYWPRDLGEALEDTVEGWESSLSGMDDRSVQSFIDTQLQTAPFERMFNIAVSAVGTEGGEDALEDL